MYMSQLMNTSTQGVQWPCEKSLNFLTVSFVLIEILCSKPMYVITIFLYNVPTLLDAIAWTTIL